jgi:hypothetical protein
MQKSYFLPKHVNVQLQRPACQKCNTHMMLARDRRRAARAVCALLPRFTDGWPLNRGTRVDSGGDVRLSNDRDGPARRVAGLNFHDRANQPRDGRSLHRHGCFLAAILITAAASRDFWIGRIKRLHVD